jgi:hypothetical protein
MNFPLHGLAPEIVSMIRGEIVAALASLSSLMVIEDSQRIVAVVVLLDEILPEFDGEGRKPWRAIPWLDCASHLLLNGTAEETRRAREHVSAARDLLQNI